MVAILTPEFSETVREEAVPFVLADTLVSQPGVTRYFTRTNGARLIDAVLGTAPKHVQGADHDTGDTYRNSAEGMDDFEMIDPAP